MRMSPPFANAIPPLSSEETPLGAVVQCPACRQIIGKLLCEQATCQACACVITRVGGIYRALPPDRMLHFSRFVAEYQSVRGREGRGSTSSDYYLALPFCDLSGRNGWQWAIRARTFAHFEQQILPRIATLNPHGADILDIGAGNGWLSYRLARKGHHPVALDLIDNGFDGLGAARHYFSDLARPFPCFQAEMDRLPFASRQFDAVIFNASFHYSVDYEVTLAESLRCLRRPGIVVIADSPLYRRSESGEQMIAERKLDFRRRFGFSSDSLPSKEYLTRRILSDLARGRSLKWRIEKPWYGLAWAFRPLRAWILRKREPSKFYLLWARIER
jgi:SAM-dependent methyltransferase